MNFRFFYFFMATVGPLLRWAYRVRYHGQENQIEDGPVIYVVNHVSMMDPILIMLGLRRHLSFVAKVELFRNPIASWFFTKVGVIPLNRGKADVKAIKESLRRLKEGMAFGIFPEGTRSRDGVTANFEPGAALLAVKSGAPVIPVRIHNTYKKFSRQGVDVTFGEPLRFTLPEGEKASGERLEAIAGEMKAAVQALSLPEPRIS